MNRIVISALVALLFSACSHERPATDGIEFVILVADSRNHVVHRIRMDGRYDGIYRFDSRASAEELENRKRSRIDTMGGSRLRG